MPLSFDCRGHASLKEKGIAASRASGTATGTIRRIMQACAVANQKPPQRTEFFCSRIAGELTVKCLYINEIYQVSEQKSGGINCLLRRVQTRFMDGSGNDSGNVQRTASVQLSGTLAHLPPRSISNVGYDQRQYNPADEELATTSTPAAKLRFVRNHAAFSESPK